jgi:drug/metabolite transporter (DMT)-like permease
MTSPAYPRWHGPALYTAGVFCGTLLDAFVKELSARHDTLTIFFARCIVALVVLLALNGWRPATLKTGKLKAHVGRGLIMIVAAGCFFYSLGRIPLVLAYVIAMTAPLMMVGLTGMILREKPGRGDWIKVAIGFAGILVSVAPELASGNRIDLIGLGAAIIGTIAYAASSLAIRPLTATETGAAIAFYPMVTGAVLSGLAVAARPPAALPDTPDLLMMAAVGIFSSGINLLIAAAMRRAPVAAVAPFEYTALLWGIGLGFFWFSETPSVWMLAGAGLVVYATARKA